MDGTAKRLLLTGGIALLAPIAQTIWLVWAMNTNTCIPCNCPHSVTYVVQPCEYDLLLQASFIGGLVIGILCLGLAAHRAWRQRSNANAT